MEKTNRNPVIVRLEFFRGERVKVEASFNPTSIFAPLHGRVATVECESTTKPGYYHCRFPGVHPEFGNVQNPLMLLPWHMLTLEE